MISVLGFVGMSGLPDGDPKVGTYIQILTDFVVLSFLISLNSSELGLPQLKSPTLLCQASLSGWQSKVRTFLKEDLKLIKDHIADLVS